jgi:thymidylate synthase
MAELISGDNLSSAWARALEQLASAENGKGVNVVVAFTGASEDAAIRATLDKFIAEWRSQKQKAKIYPVATVANTLFPQALYRGEPGEEARDRLYRLNERAMRVQRRLREKETYFNRFVNWPGRESINQLERVIERLKAQLAAIDRKGPLSSAYELAASAPNDFAFDGELRVNTPGIDNSPMGFPCLSQISFTLVDERIHLAALYRNQDLVSRAYGNYVGLARLGSFIAREVGCQLGEVLCVASHADAGFSQYGKGRVQELVEHCRFVGAGRERTVSHA